MAQTATIKSLPVAFAMMKAMQAEGVEMGRGLSTRKAAIALLPVLGRPISPATVSAVARQLDAAVAAFHRRPLKDRYRVLVRDGVVLRRKTGAGALAPPVLVALGLRPDGKKEVIDFRLASAESAAQWEQFLGDLVRRGLHGQCLEMLCVDGGAGLLAALPTAYPEVPVQRCWAHKMRNLLNKVRKLDQAAVKVSLHRIMNAATLPQARSAARRFADRWEDTCPKAVACRRADLDNRLTCFRYPRLEERKAVRTTNASERRFREVRRRTRPMGTFQDRTSMARILFAVFTHENRNQGLATPFALTQTF
jgi:putative transposase